jgi:hypothetical protein
VGQPILHDAARTNGGPAPPSEGVRARETASAEMVRKAVRGIASGRTSVSVFVSLLPRFRGEPSLLSHEQRRVNHKPALPMPGCKAEKAIPHQFVTGRHVCLGDAAF